MVVQQSLLSSEVPPRRYPLPLLPDANLVQHTQVLRIGRNAAVCDIVIHDKTSKENALNVSRVRIHDVARVMLQFAPPSAPGRIAAD